MIDGNRGRASRATPGSLHARSFGAAGAARLTAAAALALLAASCDASSTAPSPSPVLPVAFSIDLAGGAADAFDAADAIAIRVILDDIIVHDEVLPFASGGSDVRIRLPVDPDLEGALLGVDVELRRGADPLFRGGATVLASSAATDPADIVLEPVVAAIVPPPDATITSIGGTLQLSAAAVFATGDTIAGPVVTYTLVDQGVIRLLPGGVAVADREGVARVTASAGGRSVQFEVEVRIPAASVVLEPGDAIIGIGGTVSLAALVLDAAGAPLVRQPAWSSSASTVATVSQDGLVTGIAPGTATITATVDDVQGSATIEVSATPPPAAPSGLAASAAGTVVTLTWQDNAGNETSYEVRRGPAGGQSSTIATLPPDSRGYVDGSLSPDQIVDYVVVACNGSVCAASAPVTARTVPAAPTLLVVLDLDTGTRVFRLGWMDGSAAESRFDVQIYDRATQDFQVLTSVPENVTEFEDTGAPFATEMYRVVACNSAGCSPPTNTVSINFGSGPPFAVTLPTITNTEMVGATDGFGQFHEWWFEYYPDPSFIDPFTTSPRPDTTSGTRTVPLFDLKSGETLYYRILALNSAGLSTGGTQELAAPVLEPGSSSTGVVCNSASACSSNPPTITFTAFSTGPVYTYQNPFQFVSFDLESPSVSLGSGSVSVVDDPIDGARAYIWSLTVDASTVPAFANLGSFSVVARGYPGSSSGNVLSAPTAFTVTNN